MADETIEDKGKNLMMVDEGAMVRLINNTMMPVLTELRFLMQGFKKDLDHYIDAQINRANSLSEKIEDVDQRVTRLETLMSGNGSGNPDDTGVKGRLSQINEWMKTRVWFERLILGALAVEIIGTIFLLLENAIK